MEKEKITGLPFVLAQINSTLAIPLFGNITLGQREEIPDRVPVRENNYTLSLKRGYCPKPQNICPRKYAN